MKPRSILHILLFGVFLSCNSNNKSEAKDEIDDLLIKAKAREMTDSIMKGIGKEAFDKAKTLSDNCPIKIKSLKVYKKEYSTYKDLSITFTNASKKPVDAIKFIIYCEDNWGDPVEVSVLGSAYQYFDAQEKISPGRSMTLTSSLSTSDVTKAKGYVTKVHFVDGKVWDIDTQ